jgi:hypothetical protein
MRGTVKVYGAEVPKSAAAPAKMFMNLQFAQCGCGCIAQIINFILAYVFYKKLASESGTELQGDSKKFFETMQQYNMDKAWISELIGLFIFACLMVAFIALAKKCMADKNLQPCCIFEGCCACIACCSCCGFMILAGMYLSMASTLASFDPVDLCNATQTLTLGLNLTFTPTTTIAPTTTLYNLTAAPLPTCVAGVNLIIEILKFVGVYFLIKMIADCCIAAMCGAAAKYAKDAQDIFDDEYGSEDELE